MADETTLPKFLGRYTTPPEELADETNLETDAGAFGYLRGVRERALMLELRFRDGNVVALSYALLDRVEFDPSTGIRLSFAGQSVWLAGERLYEAVGGTRLFDAILRHRATWIRETGRADQWGTDRGAVIAEIRLE